MQHKVSIVKMVESSGNVQFFVRSWNFETKQALEYSCHQTKYLELQNECIKRAWMDAGFLARYFGLDNDDIEFTFFDEGQIAFAKQQRNLNLKRKVEEIKVVKILRESRRFEKEDHQA